MRRKKPTFRPVLPRNSGASSGAGTKTKAKAAPNGKLPENVSRSDPADSIATSDSNVSLNLTNEKSDSVPVSPIVDQKKTNDNSPEIASSLMTIPTNAGVDCNLYQEVDCVVPDTVKTSSPVETNIVYDNVNSDIHSSATNDESSQRAVINTDSSQCESNVTANTLLPSDCTEQLRIPTSNPSVDSDDLLSSSAVDNSTHNMPEQFIATRPDKKTALEPAIPLNDNVESVAGGSPPKSSKAPGVSGRRKKVFVAPNMVSSGSRFSSKKRTPAKGPGTTKNIVADSSTPSSPKVINTPPKAPEADLQEKSATQPSTIDEQNLDTLNVPEQDQTASSNQPATDGVDVVSTENVNSLPIATLNAAEPETNAGDQFAAFKDRPSRSIIIKTKKQIYKDHYGYESKSIRHRNALKKFKNMDLDKVTEKGEDWSHRVRDSLLMSDLIYCNPPKGSAKELGIRAALRKMEEKVKGGSGAVEKPVNQPVQSEKDPSTASAPDNNIIAPQIRLNEDGTVVLDEESLFIDSTNAATVVDDAPAIYETGYSIVKPNSFRRYPVNRRSHWSEKQTNKFYDALKVVGADFVLMSAMFRKRNDQELRRKFILERKKHSCRVDEALKQQHLSKWTNDMFMPASSSSDDEGPEGKRKSRKRKRKVTKKSASSGPDPKQLAVEDAIS